MFSFNPAQGTVTLESAPFESGKIMFDCGAAKFCSTDLKWKKGKVAVAKACDYEFRVKTTGGKISVEMKNTGKKELFLGTVDFVFAAQDQKSAPQAADYMEMIHSFNFEGNSGTKKVGLATRWLEHNPDSSMVYVLKKIGDNQAHLFSTLPPHKGDFVYFRALHKEAHLEGEFGLFIRSELKCAVKPGKTAATSTLQAMAGDDANDLLKKLGTQWAKARKRPLKDKKIGWNSWDYFAGAVHSKDIFNNQKAAKKKLGKAVKYFVIDEGWEPRWGNWVANWKFPEGLDGYCKKIRKEGGVPGVWTAPLLVNSYSEIYREHPEWFGRKANGEMASRGLSYGPMCFLDVTHPQANKFLFDTFKRLRKEGFEYFKVDFTQQVIFNCELLHDRTVPRGQILRIAFETIRKAIGEDAYLVACGAPYESVTGVVDAIRTTGDIHNLFGHILRNTGGIATRWWGDRQIWNTDPDFVVVRAPETTSDKQLNREYNPRPFDYVNAWMSGRECNYEEAKCLAFIAYLSNGDLILGDDIPQLNKKGIDMLKMLIDTPITNAAVPVDLFDNHDSLPALWLAEEKDHWLIGLFNWEENAMDIELDLEEIGISDYSKAECFWSGKKIMTEDDSLVVSLAPRTCKGIKVLK